MIEEYYQLIFNVEISSWAKVWLTSLHKDTQKIINKNFIKFEFQLYFRSYKIRFYTNANKAF